MNSMHLIATLTTDDAVVLKDLTSFSRFIDELIVSSDVNNLGKVEHSFDKGGGYTLVCCLAESHIAVHTWPEFKQVTLDVYLCNFLHDNTDKCQQLFDGLLRYYKPTAQNITKLLR